MGILYTWQVEGHLPLSTLFMMFPGSRGQEKASFAREDRGRSTLAPGWPHPALETQLILRPSRFRELEILLPPPSLNPTF